MAGFYSKDLILEWCLGEISRIVVVCLLRFGTFLTAFYRVRFLFLSIRGGEFYSFVGFNNLDKRLIFSSRILGFGAVFGGFLIQEVILDINVFISLGSLLKLRVPFSVLAGGLCRIVIFSFFKIRFVSLNSFIKLKWLVGINSKIWFLPYLSGML